MKRIYILSLEIGQSKKDDLWVALALTALAIFLGASGTFAAEPFLVQGYQRVTRPSIPDQFVVAGGLLYFNAEDSQYGPELWRSDGTAEGTILVQDIDPGVTGSNPVDLTAVQSQVFFVASVDREPGLFKSDGTAGGTLVLKWFEKDARLLNLTAAGEKLFFSAWDSVHGQELWTSDGTPEGTVLVADLNPGKYSSYPEILGAINGTLLFTNNLGGLWQSVGAPGGTSLLKGIHVSSAPRHGVEFNGLIYFAASDQEHGLGLWRSDGTEKGTVLVKGIEMGRTGDALSWLTVVDGLLFFAASDSANGIELWRSDGTEVGTYLVKDIEPGPASSRPAELTAAGGKLFFRTGDGATFYQLWLSDGTAAGTVLIKEFPVEYQDYGLELNILGSVKGSILFVVPDSRDRNIWLSDGSASGTSPLRESRLVHWSRHNKAFALMAETAYFAADDGLSGIEVWKSDGTREGTTLVKDINAQGIRSVGIRSLAAADEKLFFISSDYTGEYHLWISDGTPRGATALKDFNQNLSNMLAVHDRLFFTVDPGRKGYELWKSDGTPAGTVLVKDLALYRGGIKPASLTEIDGILYFITQDPVSYPPPAKHLWRSDGTSEGTVAIATQARIDGLAAAAGKLFFAGFDDLHGIELWISDGTSPGTRLVRDIHPGPRHSYPASLTSSRNRLFFTADDGASGMELWITDGTDSGTQRVMDIQPGELGSIPALLTDLNGTLYFVAKESSTGRELWRSDGTEGGTAHVKDIRPGPRSSSPTCLTSSNGVLFFVIDGGLAGLELWLSNGTEAGTFLVQRIPVDNDAFNPLELASARDQIFFSVGASRYGRELWVSDGTAAGTELVYDLNPGPDGSDPRELTIAGGFLFFTAIAGEGSKELWALELKPDLTKPLFIRGRVSPEDPRQYLNVTDVVNILRFLFLGDFALSCLDSADVDDSGEIDVSDAIRLFIFLFLSGPAPAGPFPTCGIDATADDLDCDGYPLCGH